MTPQQAQYRATRPFAVQRRAARVRVGEVVHLTSFAGVVTGRSTADPSPGYPDGAIVLELSDTVDTQVFKFRPAAEVLHVDAQALARREEWLTSRQGVGAFLPHREITAEQGGRLF